MKIFGSEIKKNKLLEKIGDITQIGGTKIYEYIDGVSKGIRAVDIKTPDGIDMTILIDRALDISNLSYKSVPLNWKSATRETSPIYYESNGMEWNRTYYGGLFITCGLTYVGLPCIDNGEELGLHGRISNISGEKVCINEKWEGNDYLITVQGKVREAQALGYKLEITRKITINMFLPKIIIEDTVENLGFTKYPHMIMYHINVGYPLLDSTSILLLDKAKTTPLNDHSKKDLKDFFRFTEPIVGYEDFTFIHDIEADLEGNSNIAIINQEFNKGQGLGLSLKFNKDNLPYLLQWKHLEKGEYICGIEPGNSLFRGRGIERKEGTLRYIKPSEKINYKLEFNILTSNKEIKEYKNKFKKEKIK